MKVQTARWQDGHWDRGEPPLPGAALVLYFGAPAALRSGAVEQLRARYPEARLVGCSTGGEIIADEAVEENVVAAAVQFSATTVRVACERVEQGADSEHVGVTLGAQLADPQLRCAFVLSDGIRVNGSALVRGLRRALADDVVITGGLAGDGARFGATLVGGGGEPQVGAVVAVGFYGAAFRVGHGSVGGWEPFGPQRTITRAHDNVLRELDGEPALALYKRYLGKDAAGLPGSALHFPLAIRRSGQTDAELVRTVLSVDEAEQSMTFAGDVPEGASVQLMRGSMARLVSGARAAAERARGDESTTLAVLVSCIGRKLLMGQRASDEVEAVASALGPAAVTLGFYSYGEFSPHSVTGRCELHNQTMTVTTFSELAA